MAATLMPAYRRAGNVHIITNGLHGKLTILGETDNFRIVAQTKKDRDGIPINGNLADAIKSALEDQKTVALALRTTDFYGSKTDDPKSARKILEAQEGVLASLNGKPIYVRGDEYIDVLLI